MKTVALICLGVTIAFCLVCLTFHPASAQTKRPNIIVIVADDMGYADVGVYGSKDIPTPNIDALARGGIRFTDAYVSGPYCSPTRAGLMIGRYPQRFGHEFNIGSSIQAHREIGLPLGEITIADRLKAAGYRTSLVGKWHLGFQPQFSPTQRGFDEFFGFLAGSHDYLNATASVNPIFDSNKEGTNIVAEIPYLTDAFADRAVDFIRRQKSRRFFLYVAFNAVHEPTEANEKYLARFPDISDSKRRTYAAMLSAMDDAIGRIVATLRAENLDENTLVVFFSDNGGPLGPNWNGSSNAPLKGDKGQTWEGGIRVPFIIRWKGHLPEDKIYSEPIIQLDVLPTALAAAGIKAQPEWELDGVDLVPFLTGKAKGRPHEMLFWRTGGLMALRQGDWKLVKMSELGGQKDPAVLNDLSGVELYNLKDDIGETQNLASKNPKKVEELKEAWQDWNRQLAKPSWPPVPGERSEVPLRIVITSSARVKTAFAGEWEAEFRSPVGRSLFFEFNTDGMIVTGIIRRQSDPRPLPILDGKLNGNTMTFKVKSPDGQRTITFSGTLANDEIMFQREIEEQGARPSTGFFGTAGPQTFTARRTTKRPQEK